MTTLGKVLMDEIKKAKSNVGIISWFKDAVEYYESKQTSYQSLNDKGIWNYD